MKFFLLILLLFSQTLLAKESKCKVVRAAFDIGSGATKMKVAKVDSCQQKILKLLLDDQIKVDYKEDLQKSKDEKLSKKIQKEGIAALKTLKEKAIELGAKEFYAVTTSAVRTAVNGEAYIKELSLKSGFPIYIITQKEEAKLGFVAATPITPKETNKTIVWDIGGGSMQMTARADKEFIIYEGKIASVSFKKHLIEEIQKKKKNSPNPITKEDYVKALHDAKVVAKFAVPSELKLRLKDPGHVVIGIGGVHFYSLGRQMGLKEREVYTSKLLDKLIKENLGKKDSEIKSDYASTEISNLILVKAFMEELGISQVMIGKINLADGLLISGNNLFR